MIVLISPVNVAQNGKLGIFGSIGILPMSRRVAGVVFEYLTSAFSVACHGVSEFKLFSEGKLV
jgi:hypothetical protein